ncbi:peptidoglycan-binding domain-containing protein [Streptomyces sp. NPDC048506]|uniref:peptidoglycan-binding domain-containing protein n=1 Tax=Streptomyces sp. NPDC048506 TaxID=3155028 RepID=UPI00343A56F2
MALLTVRHPDTKPTVGTAGTATVAITRTDLAQQEKTDGKLGFAGSYTVTASSALPFASSSAGTRGAQLDGGKDTGGSGTLTALPTVGQVIKRGHRVYGVDGTSVTLWYGSVPFWRQLTTGVTDGADVKELEQNLKALGYGSGLTVDKHFTDATAEAVKRWQKALGVTQTGRFGRGDVVVEPSALRVTKVVGVLGGSPSGNVLEATGTDRVVKVDLKADKASLAKKGAAVQVQVPGGTTMTGHVSDVGTVATAPDNSGNSPGGGGDQQPGSGTEKATVPVQVTLDKPTQAGKLDQAPVTVLFTSTEHKGVLAVPVTALLATVEGSYAVRVVEADGATRLVAVELGLFADNTVEVSGSGLYEGMKVQVPSQ